MKTTELMLVLTLAAVPGLAAAGDKATVPDNTKSGTVAPVTQPETDPALSNSGALVPGQPIRPEGTQEAAVPKSPMDKAAANSADVGAGKINEKSQRPSAGSGTNTPPKE